MGTLKQNEGNALIYEILQIIYYRVYYYNIVLYSDVVLVSIYIQGVSKKVIEISSALSRSLFNVQKSFLRNR